MSERGHECEVEDCRAGVRVVLVDQIGTATLLWPRLPLRLCAYHADNSSYLLKSTDGALRFDSDGKRFDERNGAVSPSLAPR